VPLVWAEARDPKATSMVESAARVGVI